MRTATTTSQSRAAAPAPLTPVTWPSELDPSRKPGGGSRSAVAGNHRPPYPAPREALLRRQIVGADCGGGTLLLHAVLHARQIGFIAIEGRGIHGSPALISRARAAADRLSNPAIGVTFEVAGMVNALDQERDLPADVVL